jgi:DNA-3-methyladenine glycosylase
LSRPPVNILPESFYANPDVVDVSRNLIGMRLCTMFEGHFTSGIITETEAYCGRNDRACHANNGLRTERTEVMYGKPGHAYIYLCYGIHHLFNVVTNREGLADAVLIRSVKPDEGLDIIKERRSGRPKKELTNGPGKLSQALGLHTQFSGTDLYTTPVWIEETDFSFSEINSSPRIGVEYAGEDAKRPWRFFVDPDSLLQ